MGTIDDYEIRRPLWHSDYYTVSLAKDKRTERPVEIWWCDTPASPRRFHDVLAELQRFRNHRIAGVLDGDITDSGAAWVACEHLSGAPLPDVMEAGPFDAVLAIEMVLAICTGLKEAHAENLIHGDIHPRHIVSADDDDVRLCGLGIVQLFGLPAAKAIATPAYRAPELLAGRASASSDIYAVGVILYELIAGRPPFTNKALRVLNDPPAALPPADHSPQFVWYVIERAIAKHPAERYRSMAEFLTFLHDTHARAWEFIQQVVKLKENKESFVRAWENVQQQPRRRRESGFAWNRTLNAIRRGPKLLLRAARRPWRWPLRLPPVWSKTRRIRSVLSKQIRKQEEVRSQAPQIQSTRWWPMPRAVEIGILMALLWIAVVQTARPGSESRPLNYAMTIPSIRFVATALPPAPSVPAPAPPVLAPAPPAVIAKALPQSPPADADGCQLTFFRCQ